MSDPTAAMNSLLRRLAGDGAAGETAPPPATPDPAPPRFAAGDGDGGARGTTPPPDVNAAMNRLLRGESA